MEYKQTKIGSDTLHMIHTDRFKTITIRVIMRDKIDKKEITKRNFLASMLVDSTKKYQTKRDLALQAEDLYNVELSTVSNRTGVFSNINFVLSILNERYTEKGMLEKSIEFLSEILFHPNITAGEFSKESFQYIKKNSEKTIRGIKDRTESYSLIRMLELLNEDSPISYRDYGYLEDLEKITPKNLAEYYEEFIHHATFDIYVLGNIDFLEIEAYIRKYFEILTYKHEKGSAYLPVLKTRKKIQTIIERKDVNQAKLTIGCIVDPLEEYEQNYVWNLYTIMLGASPDSKFFKNIREKHSVAYYVTASMRKLDHLMILKAGIDEKNFERTVELMKQEMLAMEKGDFTDEDLQKAKKIYQTVLEETEDSPEALIEAYIAMDLTNADSLDVRSKKIEEVTKEQIISFAKKVHIDTVYLLTGGKKNDETN